MKSGTALVKAERLVKNFNGQNAVDEIDFEIHTGEIVGFLGPNGAGKTTTIRMMLNLLNPTRGTLTLFGLDYNRNRSDILRMMNSSSGTLTLPGKLSVRENLRVFADLYAIRQPKERVNSLIERFDLTDMCDRAVYALSTGQQVRASLAKAFLNSPRLLLLDEPTASLDPDVADRVRGFLMRVVKEEGTTVFLTSHNMNEVSQICTRVLFLNHGKIQAEGTPKELARRIKRSRLHLRSRKTLKDLPALRLPNRADLRIDGHELFIDAEASEMATIVTQLTQNEIEIESITIHEPTLEDFFVQTVREEKS